MKYQMLWSRAMEVRLSMLSQGFESRARVLPDELAELRQQLATYQSEVVELRELESEPWPKKAELAEKVQRLAGLVGELEAEAAADAPRPG